MEYKEIIEQFERCSIAVYHSEKKQKIEKSKNMLLVSHTLERGGAPLVLLELIPFFQQEYNIVFVSISDGDLREEYLQCGVDIYIGNSVNYANCASGLWNAFDLVFLNTLISYTYLPLFLNRNVRVLWWLHEPELLFDRMYHMMIHFALLSSNIRILSVTAETAACVKKYYGLESQVLHMGLEDKYRGDVKREDTKVRFFIPAKFQMIKGQDILAQAILDLSPEYQDKAEFVFAGARDLNQPEYYDLISKLSIALPNVVMLGEISKEEVYRWYEQVDCILAPSRADATPTTIVEGMMFSRLCVCSSATGISRYITNGSDGYVFQTESTEELRKMLVYIIENYRSMDGIREKGREIYLKHFERSAVEKILCELME